jgi:serine protease AprX
MRSLTSHRAVRIVRHIVGSALLFGLLCAPSPIVRAQIGRSVPPTLITARAWAATEDGASAELLIVLKAQAVLPAPAPGADSALQSHRVRLSLWQTAQGSQRALRAWLDARHVAYRAFYIVNALLVRGDRGLLLGLAERPDVARILTNPSVAIEPEPAPPLMQAASSEAVTSIPWGVQRIGAPEVWDLGYHGEGVVVAGQDTGYQWDHPALQQQYRGWDGASVDHDYNWHDAIHIAGGDCPADSPVPCDDHGHGTHTMGTILGDDGGSNQIGVAPGARWIGCRNMREGVGTPATYIECFEFFLAPYPVGGDPSQGDPSKAPHVINNSWSCPLYEGCDTEHAALLAQTVEAVRAAGIMVVASAGNDGSVYPYCGTVDEPLGMYDAAYTVGATDALDTIAYFSSRGTGTGLIKPDISAPGVGVYSSYIGSSYTSMQGTSMASPHVVGAVALLWSARPDLIGKVAATESWLNRTASKRTSTQCGDPADAVPNNVYGWGRVNALAAVRVLPAVYLPLAIR